MQNIQNQITPFTNYLLENEKSSKTISSYTRDIKEFLLYLKNIDKPIHSIDNYDTKNYRELLLSKGLNPKTVNRKLVAIKQYLVFNQVAITIRQVKVQEQNFLDNVITTEEVKKLFQVMYDNNDMRAVALISTLFYTGMRISEALQLTIDDVDKDSVNIIGKGNKHRDVFIPEKLKIIWQEYLQVRNKKKSTYKLFTGQKGAINRHTAYAMIKKYATLSKVNPDKVFCHNLRHLYVKSLIDKGVDITSVADIVGHQNINTTRIYARKSKKELLDIINNL